MENIEPYIVTSDFAFVIVSACLCLAAGTVFAWKRPAANAFLTIVFFSAGGVPITGVVSMIIAGVTVILLILRGARVGSVFTTLMRRSPLGWFVVVCLIIGVKIIIETGVYGLDDSRIANLQVALTQCVVPLIIVLFSEKVFGQERTARDLLIGLGVFPALTVLGYLPNALRQDLLQQALNGEARFTLGMANTISSARVITYTGMAAFLFFSNPGRRSLLRSIFFVGWGLGATVLVLLTGNRQFLLCIGGFVFLRTFFLTRSTANMWFKTIITSVSIGAVVFGVMLSTNVLVKERFTISVLRDNEMRGRGEIWASAFRSVIEHPILGTGFKNFGEDFTGYDRSGEMVVLRDSAHGVVQDVFTEHGVFLGAAFLFGCFQLVTRGLRILRKESTKRNNKAMIVASLALLLPLAFSSTFASAFPVYLLLILVTTEDAVSFRNCFPRKINSPIRPNDLLNVRTGEIQTA